MKTNQTQPVQPAGYYFDKVTLNSSTPVSILCQKLPLSVICNECRFHKFSNASKQLYKHGYRSRFEIVAPTEKCLKVLNEYESAFQIRRIGSSLSHIYRMNGFYTFGSLEIARDTFFDNLIEAEDAVESLGKTTRVRWARKTRTFDRAIEVQNTKKPFRKGALGRYSFYYIGGAQTFKIYSRRSKINEKPCLHEEWKINRAAKIREKTGINQLSDLLDFDFEKQFNELAEKYITEESIDHFQLGKWMLDLRGRRNLKADQLLNIKLQANWFCRDKKIGSFADLAAYFMKLKRDIRARRGRRSAYDEKILKVDYNKFKSKKIERVRR